MITKATTRDGETLPLTKKRIRELAGKALRYGYLSEGRGGHGTTVSVTCPLAGPEWSDTHRVSGVLDQYSAEGVNVARVILRALSDHLDPDNYPCGYPDEHVCAGMRAVVRSEAVR